MRDPLLGFGHRVYRTRAPRAKVLLAAAEQIYRSSGDITLYTLAREVERYPERNLKTNVEFYTAQFFVYDQRDEILTGENRIQLGQKTAVPADEMSVEVSHRSYYDSHSYRGFEARRDRKA